MNQSACESLGYTREELLGLSLYAFEVGIPPEGRQTLCTRVMQGEKLIVSGIHKRKDETTFPVEVVLRLFPFDKQQGVLAAARDVTERKRMEEELQSAMEAALQSARTKSVFLSNISHELRTPLNTLTI